MRLGTRKKRKSFPIFNLGGKDCDKQRQRETITLNVHGAMSSSFFRSCFLPLPNPTPARPAAPTRLLWRIALPKQLPADAQNAQKSFFAQIQRNIGAQREKNTLFNDDSLMSSRLRPLTPQHRLWQVNATSVIYNSACGRSARSAASQSCFSF